MSDHPQALGKRLVRAFIAASAVVTFVTGSLMASPALAAPSPYTINSCSFSPSTLTVNVGQSFESAWTFSGGALDGSGKTYLWYEYILDGTLQEAFVWDENSTSGGSQFGFSYNSFRADLVQTETFYRINSTLDGPDGAALCSVSVTWGPNVTTYSITVNAAANGSASASPTSVASGGSSTLTATADSGYDFSSWVCSGGGTLASSTANPATLSNITAAATCTPSFIVIGGDVDDGGDDGDDGGGSRGGGGATVAAPVPTSIPAGDGGFAGVMPMAGLGLALATLLGVTGRRRRAGVTR